MQAIKQIVTALAIVWFFTLVFTCVARAEPIKIAIIDTGYSPTLAKFKLKLCETGHFDYYRNTPTIGSGRSHGTEISDIIAESLKDVDYCAVILNVDAVETANPSKHDYDVKLTSLAHALSKAIELRVNVINFSLAGRVSLPLEKKALEDASQRGIRVFVPSGNEGLNLDSGCGIYPACYRIPNLTIVGASDKNGKPTKYSNFGKRVKKWYTGTHSSGKFGTSYATARATAFYVLQLSKQRQTNIKLLSEK